jgi:hypothetical protein
VVKRLLAIDPGFATGISLWRVPEDEPIERESYWLVPGGINGFLEWYLLAYPDFDFLVAEEFIQDGRTPRVDVNALEIQGWLKGWDKMNDWEIFWQRNAMKRHAPDKLLKQHGFYVTGKQVAWIDGKDVNDSFRHALAWAKINHRPTLEFIWPKQA